MTDGQSFYVLFAVFYLIECIKFMPLDSTALASRFGGVSWTPRSPLVNAWGFRKAVFLADLPPWPGRLYVITGYDKPRVQSKKKFRTVSSIKRHHNFLSRAARNLHRLSLLNLANFFLLLPLVYVRTYDERAILITLGYGYLALLGTALHYRAVHKRLYPAHKAERLKSTLYTALLPWHSMRCADEIYLLGSAQWNLLAALAAGAKNKASLHQLQRLWREAHFSPKAKFSADELKPHLKSTVLDPGNWLRAPDDLESPQYCPCCHNAYENGPTHCSDCEAVALEHL